MAIYSVLCLDHADNIKVSKTDTHHPCLLGAYGLMGKRQYIRLSYYCVISATINAMKEKYGGWGL